MTTRDRAERDSRIRTPGRRGMDAYSRREDVAVELTGEDWAAIRPWLDPGGWSGVRPIPEMGGA